MSPLIDASMLFVLEKLVVAPLVANHLLTSYSLDRTTTLAICKMVAAAPPLQAQHLCYPIKDVSFKPALSEFFVLQTFEVFYSSHLTFVLRSHPY